MSMAETARIWTRADVLAIPDDGNRYELLDGELLVTPSPRGIHQRGVLELYRRVDPYVREHRLGYTMLAPADLDLQSDQVLQPDLFVGGLVDGREPVDWGDYAIPLLVAEIVSPATVRSDRVTKRRRYQHAGGPAYWVVDLDARLVEIWSPEAERPAIADEALTWQPLNGPPGFSMDLASYFRAVWAE